MTGSHDNATQIGRKQTNYGETGGAKQSKAKQDDFISVEVCVSAAARFTEVIAVL